MNRALFFRCGAIFLVTVRPPDEALWLVAIVEDPAREAIGWVGAMTGIGVMALAVVPLAWVLRGKQAVTVAATGVPAEKTIKQAVRDAWAAGLRDSVTREGEACEKQACSGGCRVLTQWRV